ncbi:MAG: diacylglycerol kinase family protein [Bacillota bacterium]|jgi:diacylglycerol kinase|nr:diacylglycerol kinase family protein [Bacillota bacterium]HPZ53786.1 diacylglycerol kinase family protein [Bacillota bacterium]HQD17294.1 diacylglycerol kinase family protein [Bacillota bacterium]
MAYMRARNLRESFRYALAGLWHAFVTQRNMRVHACAAAVAAVAGVALGFSRVEMAVLVLTIVAVLAAELFNTSVEAVVDLLAQQHNEFARVAKNVAAGAVLVCAVGSVLVGLLLFLPHVREVIFN